MSGPTAKRCPDCLEVLRYIGTTTAPETHETGTDYRCEMCCKTWRRLREWSTATKNRLAVGRAL